MIQIKPQELQGGQFLWGAHHPHCERHKHHLIWIKRHPLCLGCTSLFSGLAIGVILFSLLGPILLSLTTWVFGHLVLLTPTFVQPFIQKKIFKIFSRGLLGVCIASYFLTGLYLNPPVDWWVFWLAQFAAFACGYIFLSKWRNRKLDNPCINCPHGHYPVCEWNLPRLLEHPEQAKIFGERSEVVY